MNMQSTITIINREEVKNIIDEQHKVLEQKQTSFNLKDNKHYNFQRSSHFMHSPNQNDSKMKIITLQNKDIYDKCNQTMAHSRSQEQIKEHLKNQIPSPFSENIPKQVNIIQVSTFLRPRSSSIEKKSLSTQSPKSNFPYIESMIEKRSKKLVNNYSQAKQKQSLLDKLTPKQYALLTKQNDSKDSQNYNQFQKCVVNNKQNMLLNDIEENLSTIELQQQGIQKQTSNTVQQDDRTASFHNISQNQEKNKTQISQQKINQTPQLTLKYQNASSNINIPQNDQQTEQNKQLYSTNQTINQSSLEQLKTYKSINYSSIEQRSRSNDDVPKQPFMPRFLLTSKRLEEFQKEQKQEILDQYKLNKTDKVNLGFVNQLIVNAKHVVKIQQIHQSKQLNIQKIKQNLIAKVDNKYQKLTEVPLPPDREQEEFNSIIKQYEQEKAQSLERKHLRINELKINQERKVIWNKYKIDNLNRSKSPKQI